MKIIAIVGLLLIFALLMSSVGVVAADCDGPGPHGPPDEPGQDEPGPNGPEDSNGPHNDECPETSGDAL